MQQKSESHFFQNNFEKSNSEEIELENLWLQFLTQNFYIISWTKKKYEKKSQYFYSFLNIATVKLFGVFLQFFYNFFVQVIVACIQCHLPPAY